MLGTSKKLLFEKNVKKTSTQRKNLIKGWRIPSVEEKIGNLGGRIFLLGGGCLKSDFDHLNLFKAKTSIRSDYSDHNQLIPQWKLNHLTKY